MDIGKLVHNFLIREWTHTHRHDDDTITLFFFIKYGKKKGLGFAESLLFFSLSLSRETWTQELLEVVKVIMDSSSSVPRRMITRCLRVDISILCNYLFNYVTVQGLVFHGFSHKLSRNYKGSSLKLVELWWRLDWDLNEPIQGMDV
jgi:hypothetical protein